MDIRLTPEDKQYMEDLLVKRGTFKSFPLGDVKILSGGRLGAYYNNTEKVFGDTKFIDDYGMEPEKMGRVAIEMMNSDEELKTFMQIIANSIELRLAANNNLVSKIALGGGLRRDIPFVACVSELLRLPWVAIYKPEHGSKVVLFDRESSIVDPELNEYNIPLLADLITEGSSQYSLDSQEREVGWIPSLKRLGANIPWADSVVSRVEGGEQRVKQLSGVDTYSYIQIGEDFLTKYTPNLEERTRNVAYVSNPQGFGEDYIRANGVTALSNYFKANARGRVEPRVRKFIEHFRTVLNETGQMAVIDTYAYENSLKGIDDLLSRTN